MEVTPSREEVRSDGGGEPEHGGDGGEKSRFGTRQSTTSPPAYLCLRRLVFSPIRLADSVAVNGFHHLHHWLGSTGADWIQIQICIKGIHGFKLISYAPGMDQSEHHHRLAVVAADWCLRLYGWLVTTPLSGIYIFTAGLLSPPPTGVTAYTAGLLCRCCWASTSSPTGRLVRRRLVFPPARWPIMPPLMGVYVFTDRLAFAAADWCLRLHGWPIMPSLLGVYDSTTGLPPSPPTGVSVCTAGLLCHRCWASTSSPTGRLVRRRLLPLLMDIIIFRRRLVMPLPTGAFIFTTARLHYQFASVAADSCSLHHGNATLSSW
uniref:cysteine dioxygenase n=1 Tax=Oryza sativa subsp. japonica TaxID=39947 RepID=Q2QVK0_ORYSJ|nr:hypothetical protein LOC_Os12g12540 [Oryza sativa Japonica Group]